MEEEKVELLGEFDIETENNVDYDIEYCMNFVLHKLAESLFENEAIREEFMNNKKAEFSISIEGTSGKTVVGTVTIKEEE